MTKARYEVWQGDLKLDEGEVKEWGEGHYFPQQPKSLTGKDGVVFFDHHFHPRKTCYQIKPALFHERSVVVEDAFYSTLDPTTGRRVPGVHRYAEVLPGEAVSLKIRKDDKDFELRVYHEHEEMVLTPRELVEIPYK